MSALTNASPISRSPASEPEGQQIQRHGERLAGSICQVAQLSAAERDAMYALLRGYFENVQRAAFEQDLAEKESLVLLCDRRSGAVRGFSTLMRLRTVVDGQPVVAFFSGDTIIEREYWGETVLPSLWSRYVFSQAALVEQARVFWFLISSGYKTYRFLPLFFREFYPCYDRPTPAPLKRILDVVASHKFPHSYDPARGIVRLDHATPLRQGVAEITDKRRRDPHVDFFQRANPGHIYGDELACLTELRVDNLTRAGRRMVGIESAENTEKIHHRGTETQSF